MMAMDVDMARRRDWASLERHRSTRGVRSQRNDGSGPMRFARGLTHANADSRALGAQRLPPSWPRGWRATCAAAAAPAELHVPDSEGEFQSASPTSDGEGTPEHIAVLLIRLPCLDRISDENGVVIRSKERRPSYVRVRAEI